MTTRPAPGDVVLQCCDCGAPFVFTAGEHARFLEQRWPWPKRCQACREARRAVRAAAFRPPRA